MAPTVLYTYELLSMSNGAGQCSFEVSKLNDDFFRMTARILPSSNDLDMVLTLDNIDLFGIVGRRLLTEIDTTHLPELTARFSFDIDIGTTIMCTMTHITHSDIITTNIEYRGKRHDIYSFDLPVTEFGNLMVLLRANTPQ